MYLTTRQHDQLQILVSGFEIPYRSYIASEVLRAYPSEAPFVAALNTKPLFPNSNKQYQTINSELGKLKTNPSRVYALLINSVNAMRNKIIPNEIDVPNVATIISLSVIFRELFSSLLCKYVDEITYLSQALKYKFVRNKLDHRGCKTLDTVDLTVSTDFISNALPELANDPVFFWDKSLEDISKELIALQTSYTEIPIKKHNIPSMPFPDMKIVCRDKEIQEIKDFVYGRPGALRKPASLALYGYGGVGKTALALEAVKQIIQDIQDGTTVNCYLPHFILFFTAKEDMLSFSKTSGRIESVATRYTFKTASELFNCIYSALGVSSFSEYAEKGVIIIDNLETLSAGDRKEIEDFIRFSSPPQIQYIITSRNEENYELRRRIGGFEDEVSGHEFIKTYVSENDYEIELSEEDEQTLLDISMGNTLVLVLCLRRLSLNLTTINGIAADMIAPATVKKLEKEVRSIPSNGFTIVSEFMFKNSFQEIQENYKSNAEDLSAILKIFAVYPSDLIDLYTISTLIKKPYTEIEPIIDLLCRYLIIERVGDKYQLNQFAKKYIIQLFMPDTEAYEQISKGVVGSIRRIQDELQALQDDISKNLTLRRIIQDWNILSDGDKIAAAKAYKLYGDVQRDCSTMNSFFIATALADAVKQIDEIERNTMHPYVKYQKARILQLIVETHKLDQDFTTEIRHAYEDTLWAINANHMYSPIKATTSFASVLWIFGIFLFDLGGINNLTRAITVLEESQAVYKKLRNESDKYYQSMLLLGRSYLQMYESDKENNITYLRKARAISNTLYNERENYSYNRSLKGNATKFRDYLQQYGSF